MLKISIIIPMYNVELYIEECLMSCLKQDISSKDYEIIVVDDGSPDNSIEIVKRLEKQYDNIYHVSQKNSGLSEARNTGLNLAKGEFIWFVDSDDYIKEYCLNMILNQCKGQNLDALAICAADVIEKKISRRNSYLDVSVLKGIDVLKNGVMICCAPFTIYRRDFLLNNNLYFYPNIYYEDTEFTPRSYYYADKVGFSNEVLYFYRQNPMSITRTVNPKKAFDRIKVIQSLDSFYDKTKRIQLQNFINDYLSAMFNSALMNFINDSGEDYNLKKWESLFNNEMFLNRHLFSYLRNSNNIRYKLEGFLFTLFPRCTISIYRFLKKMYSVKIIFHNC